MKTETKGIDLIKKWEEFISEPYQDAVGVWTIGFGHTKNVSEHTNPITLDQAIDYLKQDLWFVERFINANFDLKQCQFDALASLLFNIGTGIRKTYLFKYLQTQPNSKHVADHWIQFRNADGKFLKGLLRRRLEELSLYYSE
jgi:lysozyme